ncbi:MAG: diacylglycerol kinase family lipid kinase [Fimbriimonadaceae bacterium]|nr:diacylglycerol kinase family lipid kinase [Fimbriimonadaceae bacterium]
MKIVAISNPLSGRGGGHPGRKRLYVALERAVELSGPNSTYEVRFTEAPGTAAYTGQFNPGSGAALARQAALEGADLIVAAGGDGTIGEVANGLVGTSATLGVLPMGTGNDFARTIGIGTDLERAAQTLIHGQSQTIDLGKLDRGGYFINVAGCGFDAEVATRVNHGFRYLRGTTAYIAAVLQTLKAFRPTRVTIDHGGEIREELVMLCAIANARTYGGGMRIAPHAELDDGLFDVVLVGDVSRAEFLRAFPRVFKGSHLSHPKVQHFRCSRIGVTSERKLAVLADGEEVGSTPVSFQIVPRALKVMMPLRPSDTDIG